MLCIYICILFYVIYSVIYRINGGCWPSILGKQSPWQIYHKRNSHLTRMITSCMKKLAKVWVQLFTELSASHLMRLFPSKFWTWRSMIMTWYVIPYARFNFLLQVVFWDENYHLQLEADANTSQFQNLSYSSNWWNFIISFFKRTFLIHLVYKLCLEPGNY